MKDQAIASCRVSTPEQKLNNSLTRQEESVLNTAAGLGVEVIRTWSGDASSKPGKNLLRKDLQEMLEFCKTNKRVKYLIVDEPDRFMRSIDEAFYFEVLFRQLGVAVWYASDPALNTGDLMSKMLKFSKLFPAEGGSVERQEKSVRGHEKALRDGRYTFPPKPGYMKGEQPGIHIPHPKTFRPLQEALKEVASGQSTPAEALKKLMSTEFSKVYKRWNMDKFRRFAVSPYYAGILTMDRQVKVELSRGQHLAMITELEHEELVRIFSGTLKVRGAKKQYNPEFPMSKVLACADCKGEARFTGSIKNNGYAKKTTKYYWKYRCRGCGREYHRDEVHKAVTQRLREVQYIACQQKEFTEALETVWRQRQQDILKEAKMLQDRLKKLKEQKSSLVVALATAEPGLTDDIRDEILKSKLEIERIEERISGENKLDDDLKQFVDFGLNYTKELVDDWWDLDYEDRVRCQQLVFPGGISIDSNKKVSTPKLSPLYSFQTIKKDLRNDRKSLLVELVGTAPTSDC